VKEINPQELKAWLDDGAAEAPLLLDVREPWEYEICRIEDARLMPMAHIAQGYKELDRDRDIVVICHHGARSAQVVSYLAQLGFAKVMNLAGGVDGWAREVDETMPTY
jgi:rhodanese-related sulfurtransferase